MTHYDNLFFQYVNSTATRSARRLLPVLLSQISVRSVLDVGCGQGAWLAVWKDLGVNDVAGIDGNYIDIGRLQIPQADFSTADLSAGFDLGRQFDVVQCLEVAEHLPDNSAVRLVKSLVRHGDIVLFSAACKGQGGDNHINEQNYEYWRAIFADCGHVAIDCLRPRVYRDTEIAPWYRYNTLVYAASEILSELPESFRAFRVPDIEPIIDYSPFPYRLRKRMTMMLPNALATAIARVKERASVWLSQKQRKRNS